MCLCACTCALMCVYVYLWGFYFFIFTVVFFVMKHVREYNWSAFFSVCKWYNLDQCACFHEGDRERGLEGCIRWRRVRVGLLLIPQSVVSA